MGKVIIVNTDNAPLKIEVQGRDGEGKYKAIKEHKLRGHASKAVVVEHGQSVQIIDISERK